MKLGSKREREGKRERGREGVSKERDGKGVEECGIATISRS